MQSLTQHTKDSPVWRYWDNWRKKVAGYETTSQELFDWLENRTEIDLFDVIDLTQMHRMGIWLFGNILRTASGVEAEGLEITKQGLVNSGVTVSLRGGREAHLIVAETADEAGSKTLHDYLSGILQEAREKPEWSTLRSATTKLRLKETQLELRRIAKEIDSALISIELIRAFPGRCNLGPV